MPTENTTANFALRYPSSANSGPNFSTGIADLANDVDKLLHLTAVGASSNVTAVNGQFVYASNVTSYTVTLPAPSANAWVAVHVFGAGSGTITVAVNGGLIFGAGLAIAGATSLKLAAANAYVWLQSEGSNWFVVSGAQDTGWSATTIGSGFALPASPSPRADVRLVGDRIYTRGIVQNTSGGTITGSSQPIVTLPTAARPSHDAQFILGTSQTNTTINAFLDHTSGQLQFLGGSILNNVLVYFDDKAVSAT